jgi:hypothetical protein
MKCFIKRLLICSYFSCLLFFAFGFTILVFGCDTKPKSKLNYCEKTWVDICESKKRFVFLVNVKECVSCRQQFYQVLKLIDTKSPTKRIHWVFDDTRKILAENAVREYTGGMDSLISTVLVSHDLYSELQQSSNFNKRSNFIVLDENDSCIYSLFSLDSKVIETSKMPIF